MEHKGNVVITVGGTFQRVGHRAASEVSEFYVSRKKFRSRKEYAASLGLPMHPAQPTRLCRGFDLEYLYSCAFTPTKIYLAERKILARSEAWVVARLCGR